MTGRLSSIALDAVDEAVFGKLNPPRLSMTPMWNALATLKIELPRRRGLPGLGPTILPRC
jgi:hypothetical protein